MLRRDDKGHSLQTEACEHVGHSSDTLAVGATWDNPRVWGWAGAVSQLPSDRWSNGWVPDSSVLSRQILCDPAEHYWNSRSCTTHVVKANGFAAEIFRLSVCSCKHPIYLTAVLLLFMTTDLNELPGAAQKGLFSACGCFHLCSCVPQKELGFKKVWVSTVVSCHLLLFLLRALGITSTQLWNRALLWLALHINMLKGSPVIKWTVQWEIPARDTKISAKKQDNVSAISVWASLQLPQLKT